MFNPKNNDIMPVRSTISVLSAFRAVFDFCQEEGLEFHGSTSHHRFLMDMYDLAIQGKETMDFKDYIEQIVKYLMMIQKKETSVS